MMRLVFVLVGVLTAGCSSPLVIRHEWEVPAPDHAAEALDIVAASYGARTVRRPAVIWYGPRAFADSRADCPGYGSFRGSNGLCVAGEQADDVIAIVAPFDGSSIADSALAHEMAHWVYNLDGHPVPTFGTWEEDGWRGGKVRVAIEALTAAGL